VFCLEQLLRVRTIVDNFVFGLRACFALSGRSQLSRTYDSRNEREMGHHKRKIIARPSVEAVAQVIAGVVG
jgi:hypothetical protein